MQSFQGHNAMIWTPNPVENGQSSTIPSIRKRVQRVESEASRERSRERARNTRVRKKNLSDYYNKRLEALKREKTRLQHLLAKKSGIDMETASVAMTSVPPKSTTQYGAEDRSISRRMEFLKKQSQEMLESVRLMNDALASGAPESEKYRMQLAGLRQERTRIHARLTRLRKKQGMRNMVAFIKKIEKDIRDLQAQLPEVTDHVEPERLAFQPDFEPPEKHPNAMGGNLSDLVRLSGIREEDAGCDSGESDHDNASSNCEANHHTGFSDTDSRAKADDVRNPIDVRHVHSELPIDVYACPMGPVDIGAGTHAPVASGNYSDYHNSSCYRDVQQPGYGLSQGSMPGGMPPVATGGYPMPMPTVLPPPYLMAPPQMFYPQQYFDPNQIQPFGMYGNVDMKSYGQPYENNLYYQNDGFLPRYSGDSSGLYNVQGLDGSSEQRHIPHSAFIDYTRPENAFPVGSALWVHANQSCPAASEKPGNYYVTNDSSSSQHFVSPPIREGILPPNPPPPDFRP